MSEQSEKRLVADDGHWKHDPSRRLWLKQAVGLSIAGAMGMGLFKSAWADQPKGAHPAFNEEEAKKFMSKALELAQKGSSAGAGGPFAGIVVKDGKIIGESYNKVIADTDPTAHGEVMAIRDACKKTQNVHLEGCDLYMTGEPCPMCLSAAYWAKINRIFFGFSIQDTTKIGFQDEFQYNEFKKPISERKVPEIQIMQKEALELVTNFAKQPNRAKY